MSVKEVIKSSIFSEYMNGTLETKQILFIFAFSGLLSLYIFFCYKVLTRKTFYVKSFSISIVATSLITTAIVLAMQSNIIVSLGMVGALSIVRFRTAVKEPQDLVFLYWSISIGIICGVGIIKLAIILSIGLSIVLFVLDKFPVLSSPMLLIVNTKTGEAGDNVEKEVKSYCKKYVVKSRTIMNENLELVFEINDKKEANWSQFTKDLNQIEDVISVSLLQHDGELSF